MEKSVFTQHYGIFLQVLRQTRNEKGLTQAQLAERLEETQSWVSKCERGEHRLDLMELRAFCRALEVPLLEFVQRVETALAEKE
ncbi:MAG TPA: helix-turn-helix transcriptional regulator [Chthonomonadaceae bacterium]|nr:helix-turn-helix transcriptional regulator [Chthonomonadaceae bacterium]